MLSVGDQKVSVQVSSLMSSKDALTEALNHGAQVRSLGFMDEGGATFRLTDQFRLRQFKAPHQEPVEGDEITFAAQAGYELSIADEITTRLLALLGREEETDLLGV